MLCCDVSGKYQVKESKHEMSVSAPVNEIKRERKKRKRER
jgi:hypothetical protein